MSLHVTIETGIHIPPKPKRKPARPYLSGLRRSLYEMEVGQSFVIRKEQIHAAKSASKVTKISITDRPAEPDGKIEMIRIWKVGKSGKAKS